jgi:hypothetical protein
MSAATSREDLVDGNTALAGALAGDPAPVRKVPSASVLAVRRLARGKRQIPLRMDRAARCGRRKPLAGRQAERGHATDGRPMTTPLLAECPGGTFRITESVPQIPRLDLMTTSSSASTAGSGTSSRRTRPAP